MALPTPIRTEWKVRLWVQNPIGAYETYQSRERERDHVLEEDMNFCICLKDPNTLKARNSSLFGIEFCRNWWLIRQHSSFVTSNRHRITSGF